MVIGCVVNYMAFTFKQNGMQCGVSDTNLKLSLLMYTSYFVLFARFFYNAYFNKIQKQLSTNNKLANVKINDSEENNLKKMDTETEEPSESKKTQWFAPAVKCIILKPDIKISSIWNTQWKRTIIWGSKQGALFSITSVLLLIYTQPPLPHFETRNMQYLILLVISTYLYNIYYFCNFLLRKKHNPPHPVYHILSCILCHKWTAFEIGLFKHFVIIYLPQKSIFGLEGKIYLTDWNHP